MELLRGIFNPIDNIEEKIRAKLAKKNSTDVDTR
jgi:hypothetical protein